MKSDNPCGEIILEGSSCGVDFEPESEEDEEMEGNGHQKSKEILIIANPEGTSSSNIEFSSQDQDPDNFEVYYALQSTKETLSSPKVYVLNQTDEKTLETVQVEDVISSSENSKIEFEDSNRFEQVLIVEEVNEGNDSPSGEV